MVVSLDRGSQTANIEKMAEKCINRIGARPTPPHMLFFPGDLLMVAIVTRSQIYPKVALRAHHVHTVARAPPL